MIKKMMLSLVFLMPVLSFAQGGGFVGKHRHRQQMQQQVGSHFCKYAVITGDEAETIYLDLVMNNAGAKMIDLSESCAQPVQSVILNANYELIQCFDRGEAFGFGSRYKCYVQKSTRSTILNHLWFGLVRASKIPACGGGRIHPRRVQ